MLSFELAVIAQLILAGILGSVIGWERRYIAGQEAGVKTYALVSIGSALFTIISYNAFTGAGVDTSRIAAQVVVGIGFLGAGTIMVYKNHIIGLTTAAGLWLTSAIGMAVGIGWYYVSIILTVLVFIFLTILNKTTSDKK